MWPLKGLIYLRSVAPLIVRRSSQGRDDIEARCTPMITKRTIRRRRRQQGGVGAPGTWRVSYGRGRAWARFAASPPGTMIRCPKVSEPTISSQKHVVAKPFPCGFLSSTRLRKALFAHKEQDHNAFCMGGVRESSKVAHIRMEPSARCVGWRPRRTIASWGHGTSENQASPFGAASASRRRG